MSRRTSSRLFVAVLSCLLVLAGLRADEGSTPSLDLGGDDRLLAHLAVDKPIYRAGETVYARAVLVRPHDGSLHEGALAVAYEVKGPRGDVVTNGVGQSADGIAPFSWTVPAGTAGGEYTLVAKFPRNGYAPAETRFDVRAYRAPRLRMDLQFVRQGYGPGDEVAATLSVTRAEGGVPAGARVAAIARVDGAEVARQEATLDEKGRVSVRFRLPEAIETGDGSLAMVVRDGGVVETAAKTIPILVDRVSIAFHPEGGDLVAGVESRVYFEARDRRDEPADVEGRILDGERREVARFSTAHEGRGSFAFVPAAGVSYVAVLDRPALGGHEFGLPDVADDGCALASLDEVVEPGASARFRLASPAAREVRLVLARLEREVAAIDVRLAAKRPAEVEVAVPAGTEGVLRATVYEGERPLTERLVFRRPARAVRVELVATPERGVPGAKVTLAVRTTDEAGRPVAATVGLAVTDDAVLEKIDRRKRAPRLPVQVLLGSEVRELADAHVYLADAPEAPRALDLLLATQGWRRFAFRRPEEFVKAAGDAARRVLALREPPAPVTAWEGAEMEDAGGAMPPAPLGAMNQQAAQAPADDVAPADPAGAEPEPVVREERAKERAGDGMDAPALRRRRPAMIEFVREYAHRARADRRPEERTDFAETVYWNAGLVTGADGTAEVSFDLSDSITSFRVRADAITKAGALGEADLVVESTKPFYLEPKLPLEVTAGDLIEVPVALRNGTDAALEASLSAEVGTGLTKEGHEPRLALPAQGSGRAYLTLVADRANGPVKVRLAGRAGDEIDDVAREVQVVPFGFPMEVAFGGRTSAPARHALTIPAGVEPTSVVAVARVFPTPLATLTEALKGILREPYGCFEQTSATAYPNIMVMNYLSTHHVDDPAVLARAKELLEKGYARLVGFECSQKGYEWFGGDPGHEALTAYGVLEFTDMAAVLPIDRAMLERTRAWLLSRRDGKGGFARNERALDSFGGAPTDITNAYIVWALLEAGQTGLETEVAAIEARAAETADPYYQGLAANVLALAGRAEAAKKAAGRLAERQDAEGGVPGAATSITRSGGESLDIETTSLAIIAWLRVPGFEGQVDRAARWLLERAKNGRFGATQSTILALKAILAYDAAHSKPKAPGTLVLVVDGVEAGRIPFTTETQGALEFSPFADRLGPGRHEISIRMEGGSEMPYAVDVRYSTSKPANDDACAVRLATSLSSARATEGEAVEVAVRVTNATKEGQPMTVAIVGLPGGLEPRHDQLKELVESGAIDAYEVRGREVVLYWRDLAPEAVEDLRISCLAEIPGTYTGPASRAYLYYTDESKQWTDGLKIQIERRE